MLAGSMSGRCTSLNSRPSLKRKACAGRTRTSQFSRLVEQVQTSVAQVEKMSKRVEGEKSLEWSVRERQLEAREKNVREMEARLAAQTKEVEEQRRKVSELVRHMEDSQTDDRSALSVERERLEKEHCRLLELQQSVREADRTNKEALKHAWAQLEDERRAFQQEQLRSHSEANVRKEEIELQERRVRQELERLKDVHAQVETARQNASRRIRETEATVANERRCLMNDLEIFEEKRRVFAAEVQKLDVERRTFQEDKENFEKEVANVGNMAAEVQRRSEQLKTVKEQTDEAYNEIQRVRGQLQEERNAHATDFERLKTMQTLVEQQRLQLLQTENQLRAHSIEDVNILVTSQASTSPDGGGFGAAYGFLGGNGLPAHALDCGGDMAQFNASPALGAPNTGAYMGEPPGSGAAPLARVSGAPKAAPHEADQCSQAVLQGGGRMPATPARAAFGGGASRGADRMQLQTLLRRTREESGSMRVFIQEQYRFLRSENALSSAPAAAPPESGYGCGSFSRPPSSRFESLATPPQNSMPDFGPIFGTMPVSSGGYSFAGGPPSTSTDTQGRGDELDDVPSGPPLEQVPLLSSTSGSLTA